MIAPRRIRRARPSNVRMFTVLSSMRVDRARATRLTAVRVEQPEHVEWLRQIRNACRAGFSRDTQPITPEQQSTWWKAMTGSRQLRMKAWLFERDGRVVGHGLVRLSRDGNWWASVALLPAFEGHGYEKEITRLLIEQPHVDHPVYSEARLDNPEAMTSHAFPAWVEVRRDRRTAVFFTSRERRAKVGGARQ